MLENEQENHGKEMLAIEKIAKSFEKNSKWLLKAAKQAKSLGKSRKQFRIPQKMS